MRRTMIRLKKGGLDTCVVSLLMRTKRKLNNR